MNPYKTAPFVGALLGLLLGAPTPARAATQAADANNTFAIDLYHVLQSGTGNLVFSPESIQTALAMTYAGARGKTAEEMARVLHFPADDKDLWPQLRALYSGLESAAAPDDKAGKGVKLAIANSLWVQKGKKLLPEFLSRLTDNFKSEPHTVNFRTDPEGARLNINNWVAAHTAKRITDLLQPGSLNTDTELVLANAIYFKGAWNIPFAKSATSDETFHGPTDAKAPMMHHSASYPYSENDEAQILSMPYVGGKLSMVIILPRKLDGLPAIEKSLTTEKLGSWLNAGAGRDVRVTLPKFTATTAFEMSGPLKTLGMTSAFIPTAADFSGMNGRKDLYISYAVHKAFIAVNEEGAEAAAATGVAMKTLAIRLPEPPVPFIADHPFLYLIRHDESGDILFIGRCVSLKADTSANF